MKATDILSIRGSLRIVHIPADCLEGRECLPPDIVDKLRSEGRVRVSAIHENIVVDDGLSILRGLIGFGQNFPVTGAFGVNDINSLQITSMRVGNATSPPAPTGTDTDISVVPPTYTTLNVTFFYPTPSSVTMVGVIPQAQATLDGVGITEEGTFAANGAMLARVTFPPEVKIPSHALQFEHSITLSRP